MTMLATEYSRYGVGYRLMLFTAAALTLAACSGSAGRFADVSDVNTSSLPAEQASDTESQPLQQSERPAWQNASTSASAKLSAKSGTIIVEPGQTLYSIARANDLTADQLAAANSIPPPYAIRVGQTLKVPGRANPVTPSATSESQTIQAAYAPSERPQFGQGATHVVRPGETLFAVGRAYQIDPFAIAQYNRLSEPYALKIGQTLRIPSSEPTGPRTSGLPTTLNQQLPERQPAPMEADRRAAVSAPESIDIPPARNEAIGQPDESVASTFRWPVQGRVISTFGAKPTGMRNEGINIAVPEGTSVRAAESGVVAYAGNELKGYGNLILIRHDGGWVTAYAHNKELFVSRGDTVKRGDVIAHAGQTGSVTSPQVHFEIRRGATAVDPMKYLDVTQAMN